MFSVYGNPKFSGMPHRTVRAETTAELIAIRDKMKSDGYRVTIRQLTQPRAGRPRRAKK